MSSKLPKSLEQFDELAATLEVESRSEEIPRSARDDFEYLGIEMARWQFEKSKASALEVKAAADKLAQAIKAELESEECAPVTGGFSMRNLEKALADWNAMWGQK